MEKEYEGMISESRALICTQRIYELPSAMQQPEHVFESLLFPVGQVEETLVQTLTGFAELRGGYFG